MSNKAGGADHKIKTYTDYGDIGLSGTEITVAQILAALPIGSALYTNNSPTSCLGADFRFRVDEDDKRRGSTQI